MSINHLHTVLGANGASGQAVMKALLDRNLPTRAVTRSAPMEGVNHVHADALDLDAVRRAIEGSSHVYVCIAFPYFAKNWQKSWPVAMQNIITACAEIDAVVIFLDNIYMYGSPPLAIPFDENHAQNPSSKKGKARKVTADLLVNAMEEGTVRGLIARSADFYGPGTHNSMLYISFLQNMLNNSAPYALFPLDIPHTYGNTLDNGRAMVDLALDPTCYGKVWHLPVGEPITFRDAAAMFNELLGTAHKAAQVPLFVQKIMGWFIPALKEVFEMRYQYERRYEMSFDKFLSKFPDFQVTPYEEGFRQMIDSFKKVTVQSDKPKKKITV